MQELAQSLEVLGLASLEGLNTRDLRKAFRKRSLQLLPERHPGTMNAHSTFEELNTAFLEVRVEEEGVGEEEEGLVMVWKVFGTTPSGPVQVLQALAADGKAVDDLLPGQVLAVQSPTIVMTFSGTASVHFRVFISRVRNIFRQSYIQP